MRGGGHVKTVFVVVSAIIAIMVAVDCTEIVVTLSPSSSSFVVVVVVVVV